MSTSSWTAETRKAAAAPETSKPSPTKSELLLRALARKRPPTIAQLCTQLGWLPHTTRAAISRLRKAGHVIETGQTAGGKTTYALSASDREAASKTTVAASRDASAKTKCHSAKPAKVSSPAADQELAPAEPATTVTVATASSAAPTVEC